LRHVRHVLDTTFIYRPLNECREGKTRGFSQVTQMTRIFFTTDIHGSEKCFMKFVNAGALYKADVLIMGGDITGKVIVPVIRLEDGTYRCVFMDNEYHMKDDDELNAIQKDIRHSGFYPYVCSRSEADEISSDPAKMDALFSQVMTETLQRWLSIAKERLQPAGIRCFLSPGNDDRMEIDTAIDTSGYVVNPSGKCVYIDDYHEMVSTGWSNPTPFDSPRETSEENLMKMIEDMTTQVKNMTSCIFNLHCPPYNSGLDLAPKLKIVKGEKLPVSKSSEMLPVGSTSVYKLIEKYQPLLGLHGHIHESEGIFKIGKTTCINTGSQYPQGILKGIVLNLDKDKIKSYFTVSG